jgi:hypothetical protein
MNPKESLIPHKGGKLTFMMVYYIWDASEDKTIQSPTQESREAETITLTFYRGENRVLRSEIIKGQLSYWPSKSLLVPMQRNNPELCLGQ